MAGKRRMTESRKEQGEIREVPLGSALPLPGPDKPLDPSDPAALLFQGAIPSSDDSPTIQSRQAPKQVAVPDETLSRSFQGKKLAHFELLDAIGKGGMATVLKARDSQLDRLVALKILPPELASDAENVRRFHQEARSAARLDHENIARVYFCGEDQKLHFIAFEFIDGRNLREIQESRRSLPWNEVLSWMIQVTRGLNHAATRGVIHRDIKPSNIIITPDGVAKLVDMGLARTLGPSEGGLTQSGMTLGTFDYISPEQALEPRDADHRSDIYSLGCTLYHLLTGHPPVPEGTAARKLYHHQHVKPTDPRVLVPDLPEPLVLLLDRMMAKNPDDRFQSMQEMLDAMLLAGNQLGMVQDLPALPFQTPPARGWQPHHTILAAFLILLAFFFLPRSSPTEKGIPSSPWPNFGRLELKPRDTSTPENNPPMPRESNPGTMVDPKPAQVARYDSEEPTLKDLQDWLSKNRQAQELEIILTKDLDLSQTESNQENSIQIFSRQVTLRGKDSSHRPTIRLRYDGRALSSPWAAVCIESDNATIQDLNFLIDGSFSDSEIHGLFLRGGKSLVVRRCEFIQAQPSRGENRKLTSVVIEGTGASKPSLIMEDSCFLGFGQMVASPNSPAKPDTFSFRQPENAGNIAILKRGNSRLSLRDCVFSPHHSMLWLEGNSSEGNRVTLQNCSMMMGAKSTLASVSEGTDAIIEMRHSLLAQAPALEESTGAESAVLLKLADAGAPFRFQGEDNRYYKIETFLQSGKNQEPVRDHGAFLRALEQKKLGADDSKVLDSSPWKDSQSWKLLEENQLAQAFAIKDQLKDLRRRDSLANRLIGAERCLDFSYLAKPLPPLDSPTPETRLVIVDPAAMEAEHTFKSLETALLQARPGDTIQIRYDGELSFRPTKLEKPPGELTIRPAPGFKPILVAGPPIESGQYPLFSFSEGTLRLEDLEIQLRPNESRERTPVIAVLGKGASLHLRSCSISLEKGNSVNFPSLLSLAMDPALMMMETNGARPQAAPSAISIDRCKIRGECNLFRNRTFRTADLQITDSFIALSGSLAKLEPPTQVTPQPGNFHLRAHHACIATAQPLLSFVGIKPFSSPNGLRIQESILAPKPDTPLIRLEGSDITPDRLSDLIRIDSVQNVFCTSKAMVEWNAPGDISNIKSLNWANWQENYQDSQSVQGDTLPAFAARDGFWKAPWSQFKLENKPGIGPKSLE